MLSNTNIDIYCFYRVISRCHYARELTFHALGATELYFTLKAMASLLNMRVTKLHFNYCDFKYVDETDFKRLAHNVALFSTGSEPNRTIVFKLVFIIYTLTCYIY